MNKSAAETLSRGSRHRFSKTPLVRKEGVTKSDIQKMSAPKLARNWPKIVAQFASEPRILKVPGIPPKWECLTCEHRYNEQTALVKIEARGRRMMACPKCGSMRYTYLSAADRSTAHREQAREYGQRRFEVRQRYRRKHAKVRREQCRRYERKRYGWEPAPERYKFNPGPNVRDLIPELGELIKSRRKLVGLSQRELAKRAGLGWTTVWRLENNGDNPRRGTFLRLAGVLGLETESMIAQAGNEIP